MTLHAESEVAYGKGKGCKGFQARGGSLVFTVLVSAAPRVFPAQSLPASDQRVAALEDLNTPRTFPRIESKAEWQARAKDLRENILVSCGLWLLPPKMPLNAHVFGKIERDGRASALLIPWKKSDPAFTRRDIKSCGRIK